MQEIRNHISISERPHAGPRARNLAGQLAQRIEVGEWSRGEKLPALRDLASEYHVSYRAMTSAMQHLEKQGFVERHHGSGTYVADDLPADDEKQTSSQVYVFTGGYDVMFWRLFSPLVESMQEVGLQPIAVKDAFGPGVPAHLLRSWRDQPPHAIVLRGGTLTTADQIRTHCGPHTRLIAVYGNSARLRSPWSHVGPDETAVYDMAVSRLLEQGHERILLLTSQRLREPTVTFRVKNTQIVSAINACKRVGKSDALMLHRNPHRPDDVHCLGMDRENVERLSELFRKPNRPTAVVSQVYRMGCVKIAAKLAGLQFGEDIQPIGVGDITPAEQGEYDCVDERYDLVAEHVTQLILSDQNQAQSTIHSVRVSPSYVSSQMILESLTGSTTQ